MLCDLASVLNSCENKIGSEEDRKTIVELAESIVHLVFLEESLLLFFTLGECESHMKESKEEGRHKTNDGVEYSLSAHVLALKVQVALDVVVDLVCDSSEEYARNNLICKAHIVYQLKD